MGAIIKAGKVIELRCLKLNNWQRPVHRAKPQVESIYDEHLMASEIVFFDLPSAFSHRQWLNCRWLVAVDKIDEYTSRKKINQLLRGEYY